MMFGAFMITLQNFLMAFYSDFYTNLACSKAFVVLYAFNESFLYVFGVVLSVILYVCCVLMMLFPSLLLFLFLFIIFEILYSDHHFSLPPPLSSSSSFSSCVQ